MMYSDLVRRTCPLSILFFGSVILLIGCRSGQPAADAPVPKSPPPPLRLLVIGDSGLAKVIKREWEARTEGELTLRELEEDDFFKLEQPRLAADAIVYPSVLLGELAAREWLAPLPKDRLNDPAYQSREIFAALRKQEMFWEEETYAVPLGGPSLVLFYRRDVFDKLSLKLPQTWGEYREINEKLANREQIKEFLTSPDAKWFGASEPLKDLWAAKLLLGRAAAYAKHRSQFSALFDYRTMTPLIDGPPFVRALQELAAAAKLASPNRDELSPDDTIRLLHQGECAMAIGWLADTNDWRAESTAESRSGPSPAIGVTVLPGSRDVYNFRSSSWEQRGAEEGAHVSVVGISGRLGSLTKECRQPGEAVRLLLWLSGPEMSAQISAASPATGPFRQSHVAQIDKWTGPLLSQGVLSQDTVKQYAEALQHSLSEPNCLTSLRIPGRDQYLESLAESIHKTLAGQASADASLAEVAQRWQEITESLGRETQRLAYARSIGLRP